MSQVKQCTHNLFSKPQNFIPIQGPVGQLEAIVTPPVTESNCIMAVICHPHPLHGGTMQNKVVSTLARTFNDLGVWSIRFNFRGVGSSQGVYDHGIGETDDLLSILVWVKQQFPSYQIWLAGFSFGAYIAIQSASRPEVKAEVKQLITIAPAVNHFDLPKDKKITCPWLLIMGEEDEIVPVDAVKKWIQEREFKVQARYLPQVGHFFHGHLTALKKHLYLALADKVGKI